MILNKGSVHFNIIGGGFVRIFLGDQYTQFWHSIIYCHYRLLQLAQHSKVDLNESTRESAIIVFKSDVEVYEKKVAQLVNWKSRVYVRMNLSYSDYHSQIQEPSSFMFEQNSTILFRSRI